MAQSKTSKHPRLAQLIPSARVDASLAEDGAGGGNRLPRGLPPSRESESPLLEPVDAPELAPEPPPELALGSPPPEPDPELAEGSVDPLEPGSTGVPEEEAFPLLLAVAAALLPFPFPPNDPEEEPKAPPSTAGSTPAAHPKRKGRARMARERAMGMGTLP
jgi:hypothetical protein